MWTILYNIKYSWTLTNMGLNYEGPLSGYFSLNAFYSTTGAQRVGHNWATEHTRTVL